MPKLYKVQTTQPASATPLPETPATRDLILMDTFDAPTTGSVYRAYASASDVANLCRNLLGAASAFDDSTSPNITAINGWLSSGCGVLETNLSTWGYTIPVASTATLYEVLRDLNTLYAAARAEMSRINITLAPGERTRGQLFLQMFDNQLAALQNMELSGAGATPNVSDGGTLFTGGLTDTSKDVYRTSTSYVQPRFKRDTFYG